MTWITDCDLGRLVISALVAVLAISPASAKDTEVEADNGSIYHITTIQSIDNHWRGGDKPYALAGVATDDGQFMNLTFDCEGSYAHSELLRLASRAVSQRVGSDQSDRVQSNWAMKEPMAKSVSATRRLSALSTLPTTEDRRPGR